MITVWAISTAYLKSTNVNLSSDTWKITTQYIWRLKNQKIYHLGQLLEDQYAQRAISVVW